MASISHTGPAASIPVDTVSFKSVLTSVLSKKDFNLRSERCAQLQEFGKRLLACVSNPANSSILATFIQKLSLLFDTALSEAAAETSFSSQREKAWSKYHCLRCTTIPVLWDEFLRDQLGIKDTNSLLIQTVVQELFKSKLKEYFPSSDSSTQRWLSQQPLPDISDDEKNTLMYACGYVPLVLIRRYKKRKEHKYESYVECLLNMAVGAFEDSFYDYCRKWFEEINRGGAFEVNDCAFNFFLCVEINTRSRLTKLLQVQSSQATEDQKMTLLKELSEDEDIRFHWSLLSVDCDGSTELLREILSLWITIRGGSIAGCWMEQYKRVSKETSKTALRKGLKRKSTKKELKMKLLLQ